MKYIYLIHADGTDFYKIGFSQNADMRLSDLQCGCPYALRVAGKWSVDNAASVEAELHRMFSGVWVRGEWFILNEHDLAKVQDYCQSRLRVPRRVVRRVVENVGQTAFFSWDRSDKYVVREYVTYE